MACGCPGSPAYPILPHNVGLGKSERITESLFISRKARKIKKMLMCKMRYNRTFNKCDLMNIEKYGITLEVDRSNL